MASIFGHAVFAITLGQNYPKRTRHWKFWTLGVLCTILPDADVISFKLGIPYEDFWGHRGFSHSFVFALLIGFIVTVLFYRKKSVLKERVGYFIFFTLCTASHSVLDAMTTGGLGVAFFSPWDDTRYFFPWRPIKVSPIGVRHFFGERGLKVLLSEFIWIGIPALCYTMIVRAIRKKS